MGLLKYPGPYNKEDGVVAMAHRAQPSLETPGIAYLGRSIYTSFGLEGVNDSAGVTSRAELLQTFFNWAWDKPTVTISNTTVLTNSSELFSFDATTTASLTNTVGVSYRWDFGDGSPYTKLYNTTQASHSYAVCGTYTIRVESTDSFGNRAIGKLENLKVTKDNCKEVNQTGGTLNFTNLHGAPFTVLVPTGSLSEASSLIYEPTLTITHALPTGLLFAGQAFNLNLYQKGKLVSPVTFTTPLTLTLHYTAADVVGLNKNGLTLRYWNGLTWADDGLTIISRGSDQLVVAISHLSEFALFGQKSSEVYLPIVVK